MKKEKNEEMKKRVESKEHSQVIDKEKEYYELYKRAYLENDTGVSNEFCQNTTSWD